MIIILNENYIKLSLLYKREFYLIFRYATVENPNFKMHTD